MKRARCRQNTGNCSLLAKAPSLAKALRNQAGEVVNPAKLTANQA